MAIDSSSRPKCPLNDTTIISRLFFGWAWSLLDLGSTRPLEEKDLPDIHQFESSAYNREYINKHVLYRQQQLEMI